MVTTPVTTRTTSGMCCQCEKHALSRQPKVITPTHHRRLQKLQLHAAKGTEGSLENDPDTTTKKFGLEAGLFQVSAWSVMARLQLGLILVVYRFNASLCCSTMIAGTDNQAGRPHQAQDHCQGTPCSLRWCLLAHVHLLCPGVLCSMLRSCHRRYVVVFWCQLLGGCTTP